jgi:phospholipase/carboxylesterase
MDFDRRVDEEGVRRSGRQAVALIQRERDRGVAPERIVIAGFSQGGAIAFHTGLRYPERLAGILALSTYIAADCDLEAERSAANHDIPILQCHGTDDPMVLPGMGEAARDRLTSLGYQVDWKTYPMQHQVCPQEIDAIGAWLQKVLPG